MFSEYKEEYRNINSKITIGNQQDPSLNPTCFDNIADSGWYECAEPMIGPVFGLIRKQQAYYYYKVASIRAYTGINVAKWATINEEPTGGNLLKSAENLLWQYPRTARRE